MLMTSGLSGSGHQPPHYGRHFFIVLYSLFNAKYWKLINLKDDYYSFYLSNLQKYSFYLQLRMIFFSV